jgi:hypothetical protein
MSEIKASRMPPMDIYYLRLTHLYRISDLPEGFPQSSITRLR